MNLFYSELIVRCSINNPSWEGELKALKHCHQDRIQTQNIYIIDGSKEAQKQMHISLVGPKNSPL
jgi:hypothetical protein